mmetsp:Transcript_126893/g.237200  ORF Transcript_126893/g.237200 Transcript_126893/m.237200 type:complete len:376 (-) Transcript_126893:185-1312(-)
MGGTKRKYEGEEDCRGSSGSKEVLTKVFAAKAILEAHISSSHADLLLATSQLRDLGQLSTEVLQETQIGKLVNRVSKEAASDEVRQSLKDLLAEWKRLFKSSAGTAQAATKEKAADGAAKAECGAEKAADAVESLTMEVYRKRLTEQKKYYDCKPGTKSVDNCLQDPPTMPPLVTVDPKSEPLPQRTNEGHFLFPDFSEFKPNLSPKQVLQAGSFGGTYFRDISSAVTGVHYKGKEVIKEFPEDWFQGLCLEDQVVSQQYRKTVNKYFVSCGGSLGMWETSGWISAVDPYGWFQWYCRFFLGRRSSDDARQVDRWLKGQGPRGRWRLQLMNKIIKDCASFDDAKISPVIRQVLQHWAYELTPADLEAYKEKKKNS